MQRWFKAADSLAIAELSVQENPRRLPINSVTES
ncbi:uncharacterized protein METZ01_LOCUS158658, partial [marine metagenome]